MGKMKTGVICLTNVISITKLKLRKIREAWYVDSRLHGLCVWGGGGEGPPWSNGSVLGHGSLLPVFESHRGHSCRVFHL